MKKTITLSIATFVALGLMSFAILELNGIPDLTGGHGESNCTDCHGDFAVNTGGGSVSISSSPSLANGYSTGTTYTISVTVAKTGQVDFGFDFEALNSNNTADAGSLATGSNPEVQIMQGASFKNMVHTDPAFSSNTHTFTFNWTAPATNIGNVIFYASGNAANGSGTGGDYIYTTSLTISPGAPPALSATIAGTNVTCNGACNGSAQVTPTGGSGTYTYLWAPSGGSAATATGLCAGTTYTCTITGGGTVTKTVLLTAPAVMSATVTSTDATCSTGNNGSATVTPSGGTAPYSYSWNTSPIQTGATATSLAAGTYTCTITGSGSASCTFSKVVTIATPAAISATSTSTNVACFGNSTGSATVTPSGGTAPYTYSWNTTPVQTSATASNLAAGTYTCTITGSGSVACTGTKVVTITQPATGLSATAVPTNVTCFNGTNGSATATPAGGTPPYSFSWNTVPAQTTATATNLAAGTYTCTVGEGSSSCTATVIVTITAPTVVISSTNVNCFGDSTGTAIATVAGGTAPYTYSWNSTPVQAKDTATGLAAGTYTCTITINGSSSCSTTEVVTITQPATALSVVMDSTVETVIGNGTATATPSGGIAPYTYDWWLGDSTQLSINLPNATGLVGGTYFVYITDDNGCSIVGTVLVNSTVGIVSTNFQSSVKVYPNPSKGDFSVEINALTDAPYTLNILNSLGQTVKTERIDISAGKNIVPLSLDATLHGVFIVEVISNQGIMNIPITKLK